MTTPNIDPTRVAVNPSDSILMSLARVAMAPGAGPSEVTWPALDLNDPKQREFGDYELLEEIGRGGMGVVYRARQRSLDRDVAIKFIAAGIADSFNVARFLGEARAAARLMHPNIVPVHEVGSIDGVHYFSMPLVKGRTLADALDSGPWSEGAIVALMLKLCDAIDYAHRLGLLHLDLKPANVLLDERGEPLITDFGLARHMDASHGVDAQEVSGTPSFMAPEQILIKQYRLTPATDLYALGAILYRALSGVSPHGIGQPDELTQRAIAGRVRPLRELNRRVSPDLAAVAMKCLELLPKDRYAKVAALSDDLRRIRDGLPVSARQPGVLERLRRWGQKPEAAVLALLIAAVVGTGKGMYEAQAAEEQASLAKVAAVKERDLAREASELGAWLYAQNAVGDREQRAVRTLAWLQQRFPEQQAKQAGVLTAFVTALKQQDEQSNTALSDSLVRPIVQHLGQGFRREVIAALESGSQPDRYALAARLAWFDEVDSEAPSPFAALLDKALVAQPEAVEPWHIAATFCRKRCLHPEAPARLTAIAPNNMYHWLLAAMSESQTDPAAMLAKASKLDLFDDYFGDMMASYLRAVDQSGLKAPALLSEPARVVFPRDKPEFVVAMFEASAFPLTSWQRLTALCDPRKSLLPATNDYDTCRTIGTTMARSKGSLLARMIGSYIVRRITPGTPLEYEMIELDRRYAFVTEMQRRLTTKQLREYPFERYMADMTGKGELETATSQLAHYDLPTEPPAGWQPEDTRALMLPEERDAWDKAHPPIPRP